MLIGNLLVLSYVTFLAMLLYGVFAARKKITKLFRKKITATSIAFLVLAILLFLVINFVYMHHVEQLYFDENIYQGIALNILKHADATWCQTGSAYLNTCANSVIYHDPPEYSFYLAIYFAIFGSGVFVAGGLQTLFGLLSIIWVFLTAIQLFDDKIASTATLGFAVIPQLFIWSNAMAVPDLAFMSFSTLAMALFILYKDNGNIDLFVPFVAVTGIAVSMRMEGVLLIPVFVLGSLFYELQRKRKFKYFASIEDFVYSKAGLLVLFAAILLLPQFYNIGVQLRAPDYGQSNGNNALFSIGNLINNAPKNFLYLLGQYNQHSLYPSYFSPILFLAAVVGFVFLIAYPKKRKKLAGVFALLLWAITYNLFYDLFYAGSVTYGVDVRFMLQVLPAIAILAGVGIVWFAEFLAPGIRYLIPKIDKVALPATYVVLMSLFLFFSSLGHVNAYALEASQMPQQSLIYQTTNFLYQNFDVVPRNCTVYSFTPEIWQQLGRNAMQISNLTQSNSNSCEIFDYGYWCVVPPFMNTTCKNIVNQYYVKELAGKNVTTFGVNHTLRIYQILSSK